MVASAVKGAIAVQVPVYDNAETIEAHDMPVQIITPTSAQSFSTGTPIAINGTASSDVVNVRIASPYGGTEYVLGTVPVTNGAWQSQYAFNTVGRRRLVVRGLDRSGNEVANAAVEVELVAGSVPSGQVAIASPANQATLELGLPVLFQGTATGDVANIQARTMVAGTPLILGTMSVVNGTWAFNYTFNTGGDRQILIDGFDRTGRLLATAAVTFSLKAFTRIASPTNGQAWRLEVPVEFRGTTTPEVTSVRIVSPVGNVEYPLGKAPVVQGAWALDYTFNGEGDRTVIVYGLNGTNDVVSSAVVKFSLVASGVDPSGRLAITTPPNASLHDVNAAIAFRGTATGDVVNLRIRTPFAGTDVVLGSLTVVNGTWGFNYAFNTGGERKLVIDGLDRSGQRLASSATTIILRSPIDPAEPFGNGVIGIENTSRIFRDRVIQLAARLRTQPIFLMAAMSFETGGTFSPSIQNRLSRATGLIQFLPSTAISLGTSIQALAQMTAERQLDFVEKYFVPFTGRLNILEDVYMAILYPRAVGMGRSYVLFRSPSVEYQNNRGLDSNLDGAVTVAEAADLVRKRIL